MEKTQILNYKYFATNEEFVAWQKEHSVTLYNVLPLVTRADSVEFEQVKAMETIYGFQVFVTFTCNEEV